jgi:nucleoside-triphosphatase THEP1
MIRRTGWLLALAATAAVFLRPASAQAVALALALAAALLVDRRVLAAVLRLGVVLMLLFAAAVTWAVVAWSSDPFRGLEVATAALLRLLVLVIITALLARNVDADALLRGAKRFGLERLVLVLGLALNVLPRLVEAFRQVVMAWRVRRRGGMVRAPSTTALVEVMLAHVARIADEAAAAAALRGHAALVRVPVVVAPATRVVVATGAPGAGKTTAVAEAVERLQESGLRVSGFLQPGRFRDGDKIGFGVRDLASGEEAELARLVTRDEGDLGTKYRFENEGFELARAALGRVRAGDLVVIDELGPLELQGKGHMPAVRRILRGSAPACLLVVVRRHLVPALLTTLGMDDVEVVDVTVENGTAALIAALPGSVDVEKPAPNDGPALSSRPTTGER